MLKMLRGHADQAAAFPDVSAVIEEHMEETARHIVDLRGCLEDLGVHSDHIETPHAGFAEFFKSLPLASSPDLLIRNTVAEIAAEHMEIACYRAIVAAASELDEPLVHEVCERILEEEEAMADALAGQLPDLTLMHLGQLELRQPALAMSVHRPE